MAIKYLKKAIKTPSTDDHKTRTVVQNILNDIEKNREDALNRLRSLIKKCIVVQKKRKATFTIKNPKNQLFMSPGLF